MVYDATPRGPLIQRMKDMIPMMVPMDNMEILASAHYYHYNNPHREISLHLGDLAVVFVAPLGSPSLSINTHLYAMIPFSW